MCGLRTRNGVNPQKLLPFISDIKPMIQEIADNFETELRKRFFESINEERIALTQKEGFLLSNRLIVKILNIMDEYIIDS